MAEHGAPNACLRCSFLHVDPAQADRLVTIVVSLNGNLRFLDNLNSFHDVHG
jgi:hypothetical protein